MASQGKKFLSVRERSQYHCVEEVVGCKWSASVVAAIAEGVKRPGALERYIPGISTKVLNERLRKLAAYGMVSRHERPGLPAHVEYHLTEAGAKLADILHQLKALNVEHDLHGKEGGGA